MDTQSSTAGHGNEVVTRIEIDKIGARIEIGKRLREAREKAGLTIRSVADMTGLSKTIICNTESGHSNITIDSLNTLAAAYGLSVRIE